MRKTNLKQRKRSKRGSSLPMVLAIGLVLVIWVMGLSPIIATQGKASIDVQHQEGDYLQSRSAIEFTKGELVNMVDHIGRPMTFAVVKGAVTGLAPDATEDAFTPIAFETNRPLYENYVDIELGSLTGKGTPQDTDLGNEVCAICHVEKPSGSNRDYKINVTTFSNGEANLTYNTTYTPPLAAATIYPEAYKKTQALPISDFVIVDGKLGDKVLWDSPLTNGSNVGITSSSYINGAKGEDFAYAGSFYELLLGIAEDGSYSDAGYYPAVFKTTAEAAIRIIGEAPGGGPITDVGSTTVESFGGAPALDIKSIVKNGSTATISVDSSARGVYGNYVLFGYSKDDGAVTWSRNRSFSGLGEGSYYFYCYIAGHERDGKLYASSPVAKIGPITVIDYAPSKLYFNSLDWGYASPSAGTPYIMGSQRSGNTFKYLYADTSSLLTDTLESGINVFTNGILMTEASFSGAISNELVPSWSFTKSGSDLSPDYQFRYDNNPNNLGLHQGTRYEGWSRVSYYSLDSMTKLKLVKRISASSLGLYSFLDLDKGEFYNDDSTNENQIYFYKIPTSTGINPTTLTYSDRKTVIVEHDATVEDVYEKFSGFITGADTDSLKLYFRYTGTNYEVFATWTQGGLPYFAQLGTLTVQNPDVPEEDVLTGFVMAGQSLYFMGEDEAIDTNGETVNLLCDLLVIRDDIDTNEGGQILVRPHSGATTGQTLVFFVNGTSDGLFKDHNFYLVKAKTDLSMVTEDDFGTNIFHVCDNYGCYDSTCDGSVQRSGGVITKFSAAVVDLSTYGYPVVNLDVAYATDEQLGHIVSGEAIGWTDDGVLSGNSNTDNALYVVCAYVKSVGSNIKYSANRIMIAAENSLLSVGKNMELHARYISFDAGAIQQVGSTKLEVYSLLENHDLIQSIIQFIQNLVGTNADFNSGTLQVEYEQETEVRHNGVLPGDGIKVNADIFRYKTGTNLFTVDLTEEEEDGADAAKQQLRVSYDTSDFMEAFEDAYHLHTVERYMDITESVQLDMPIERALFEFPVERHLNLYSNFISFDESVTEIKLGEHDGILAVYQSDIIINTQESGYTEKEYLGFFRTNSADTYNGTILQVKGDKVTISRGSTSYALENGFYFVGAVTDGTSLFDVAKEYEADGSHYITNKEMLEYAQSLSDNHAYVDTGLETSEMSAGGFGGGSVN